MRGTKPAVIRLKDLSGLYPRRKRAPLQHAKLYAGAAVGVIAAHQAHAESRGVAVATSPAADFAAAGSLGNPNLGAHLGQVPHAFTAVTLASPMALALAPPPLAVGDMVLNPVTGLEERVVQVVNPVLVLTDKNNTILLAQTVGETFTDTNTGKVYTVQSVLTNGQGKVITVNLQPAPASPGDPLPPIVAQAVVTDLTAAIAATPVTPQAPGANGTGSGSFVFPTAAGDVNQFSDVRPADDGDDGSYGAGLEICAFGGCITIGANASDGGNGDAGQSFTATVDNAWGDITTVSNKLPGIAVISEGGNGGDGGSGYGVTGGAGGRAGAGGNITVNSSVTVTTTGVESHGLLAQSVSGVGGKGGSGYLWAGGGSSGPAGQGGSVTVNHSGEISTSGAGAAGILAESLGGNAGTSGGSYGIVGLPNDGSVGGNGGTVIVNNSGIVQTGGVGAYGIAAQSIGGDGGNVGGSGGIVAFGGTAGNGGSGGSATINAQTGSRVTTSGAGSYGLFAQSVGGGGGSAGASGGIVAFGSDGSTAGNGGSATVNVASGALVSTSGTGAHAVFAESVGGGGGAGAATGGAVAVGGKGGSGGNGGSAAAGIAGTVSTTGNLARGVYVQSVGGGGGSAEGSGGIVSLGGSGSAGGSGGSATGSVLAGGSVTTTGFGSDALYVQSVGGGGGSGSTSGGVVALGGTGGIGGNGGTVTVTNAGSLATSGPLSRGILAQSVGGGGGTGGDSGGLVTIGGNGSGLSTGGTVTVTNTGSIATGGSYSTAIHAQSIGGGGGDGGSSGGVFLTIGGKGGGGGYAGRTTVNHSGVLETLGNDSHGIFAQSVGGGGGNGGSTVSLSAFVGVAIGGNGGLGGDGGTAIVNLTPRTVVIGGASQQLDSFISTSGDRSRGIQVQSVGGGGGNGGFAVQATGGYLAGVSVAVGGNGAAAGDGGHASLDGRAVIVTDGESSQGILAQSVGGGGGSGGFAVSFAGAAGQGAGALSVGIGGSGASGGSGGLVEVDSGGAIQTLGNFSTGLVAQSVGGGGGNGGFSVSVAAAAGGFAGSVAVGVGGSAGNGGDGGRVDAGFDGTISTSGDDSRGALIQSVGGGGGDGGFSVTGAIAIAQGPSLGISVGVGGSGGSGGDGSVVDGAVGGNVQTLGDRSTGVLIQSAGGGGGSGGFNVSGAITGSGTFSGGIAVGLGGSGGGGGDGDSVTGSAGGTIYTEGSQSDGFVVQSAGGGGGTGGFNVAGAISYGGKFGAGAAVGLGGAGGSGGYGGKAVGDALGAVRTLGNQSRGVVVQSSGGGGGNGGFNVSGAIGASGSYGGGIAVGLGGSGGSGGDGGDVVASAVSILTEGAQSGGFLAQSKGGGGGAGAFNVSGSIGVAATAGGALSIGLGGSGGGGGDAMSVLATVVGDVTTLGFQSDAIVAQSVGGGGGAGAFNVSGGIAASGAIAGAINVGIGGSGGDGGDAGLVDLDVTGAARTSGDFSGGILAQSTGGGGGAGAINVAAGIALAKEGAGTIGVGVGGQGGGGGNAGAVFLDVNQGVADPDGTLVAVSTTGVGSRGLIAQSVGGGGGDGGFNVTGGISAAKTGAGNIGVGVGGGGGDGGNSGDVTAKVNGDILTGGTFANGALVQSVGGGGGNGGFNVTGGIAGSKNVAGNLMVGVGGFGGAGGDSGSVDATLTGDIRTEGAAAYALTVQSLGGGGGNGAFNVTGGITLAGGTGGGAGTIGVGVGGFGGDGGQAAAASADFAGTISTQGSSSHGALVQSAGGGGGNGAFNVTGGIALSSGIAGTVGFGLGGFGGGGGDGAIVDATLTGNVSTQGSDSFGAMIQSLGGGGGNGGLNVTGGFSLSSTNNASISAALGVGGFGGSGGDSARVDAQVTGLYTTLGANSDGVIAQSVAGGGGNGGLNVSGAIALSTGTAGTASIGIGGFGGGGGRSGDVSLIRTGNTFTSGMNSDGVVAQSVAGGGGSGGINVSGGISGTSTGSAGSFGFGLGGFGGAGGDAGNVLASVTGNVSATGNSGIVVTPAVTVEPIPEWTVTFPAYRTIADGSHGIIAQSVGGGGGNGGINVTGQVSITLNTALASRTASLGIGGFGGGGGNAGTVGLTVAAPGSDRVQMVASGDEKSAVIVQSVGGGGGAGGINISGGVSLDGQLVAGVGGFGGGGGLGNTASAVVDADLFASGTAARGLFVQSVGGGGGAGGINISGGIIPLKTTTEPSLVFGIGGFGGAGNSSGNASAKHHGQVLVDGTDAIGILVQSIAGGGGSGGLNVAGSVNLSGGGSAFKGVAFAAGLGGTGGTGADAGTASLISTGNVLINSKATPGVSGGLGFTSTEWTGNAPGILVQSIGGGGGVGGINVAGAIAPSGSPITLAIGGTGGAGGNGGAVDVTRGYKMLGGTETEAGGLIRTFGKNADGLIAQSIGGGGGNAGINLSLTVTANPIPGQTAVAVNVGGSGGDAGNGDDVTVRHLGDIFTSGDDSDGVQAQSISKGGGSGTYNFGGGVARNANLMKLAIGGEGGLGGTAGDVSVAHKGNIFTEGKGSVGIRAQSIGGGGGNASTDLFLIPLARNTFAVTLGKTGGSGGVAGRVDVTAAGTISTSGDDSTGIFAQSIGGGGGASGSRGTGASATPQPGSTAPAYSGSVAVGLDGGAGATGGAVTVGNDASIGTRGTHARGIMAQSIGGGGGLGGGATSVIINDTGAATVAVGGQGGTGATSSTVDVRNGALISTEGNEADGILAQSVGGGGGVGGQATTFSLQLTNKNSATSFSVAVGGSGGGGGTSGNVGVHNTGTITTKGFKAFGVRAQSIGGGGGIGGAVADIRLDRGVKSQSLDINVGGSGGTGNIAGAVEVINEGLIWTTGEDAAAISANSIGGGGGDAGLMINFTGGIPGADTQSHRAIINVGGSGGDGGKGGAVTVANRPTGTQFSGSILTEGKSAYGIFAQSLGGGGGNSSSVVALSAVKGGTGSIAASLSFGASGGTGNTGGTVDVVNSGFIETKGENAHGIFAQSLGGGGGNGGMVLSGNLLIAPNASTPMVTVGGSGGDGGDGGKVTVTNSGTILTRGANAHGILAQSIGGGGGNAGLGVGLGIGAGKGNPLVNSSIAGFLGSFGGGTGGIGGEVVVDHSGDITVLGEGSDAIKAESINGGGGTLGFDFDGIVGVPGVMIIGPQGEPEREDPMIVARAGADNASGMNAAKVTVNSTGTLGVAGANGVGVFNQSIGGGGGTIRVDMNIATLDDDSVTDPQAAIGVHLALGGIGGAGNGGADIGGGHSGNVVTNGDGSPGALFQSIGGGGGRAMIDVTAPSATAFSGVELSLGGEGVTDSSGGDISRTQAGAITTTGDFAPGAIFQSIGGGGGSAIVHLERGNGLQSTLAALRQLAVAPLAVDPPVSVALGANGGAGLDGGAVNTTLSGGATTTGNYSPALVLQSVGAGGGEVRVTGNGAATITLGGTGGASGNGGNVTLFNTGQVNTGGTGSHGVFLQSIGGGGGAVFGNLASATVTLSAANSGNGGAIAFQQNGSINVSGDRATGVVAQSLGGGGGWVDGAFWGTAGGAGAGGAIALTLNGAVAATGAGSTGVFAQSLGTTGAGDMLLTSTGAIRGGSGSGAGVRFAGGANNRVLTSGSISSVSALAIDTGAGNDRVENNGIVIGNIDLGSGANTFLNQAGSSFIAYSSIDLRDGAGSTGSFTNAGSFQMGLQAPRYPIDLAAGDVFAHLDGLADPRANLLYGARVINTVALDGNFIQTAAGNMAFDAAFGAYASDRVNVTGNTSVAGTGDAVLTWLENANPVTLFATAGTATNNGLQFRDTLAIDYSVLANTAGIQLGIQTDFGLGFLNANERALGGHMDSAVAVGGSNGIGRLLALVGNLRPGEEAAYKAIFEQLNPESFVVSSLHQFGSARDFSGDLFGCRRTMFQPAGEGCSWSQAEMRFFSREGDGESSRVSTELTGRLRTGFETPLGGDWMFGSAIGYDSIGTIRVGDPRTTADGDGLHAGLGLRYASPSGAQFSVSASSGRQWLESRRMQDIFGPRSGTANQSTSYYQGSADVGYVIGSTGSVFARPGVRGWVTALRQDGFRERGLQGLGIESLSDTQVIGTVNPELAIGVRLFGDDAKGGVFTLTGGGVFHSEDRITAPFRLLGANPSADPAWISTAFDRSAVRFGAAVDVVGNDRFSVRLRYTGEKGERTENHRGGVDVKLVF